MYQPKRVADAAISPASKPAFAGPRRAVRRRSDVLGARVAPVAVSLSLLAGTGAFVLSQRPAGAATEPVADLTVVRTDETMSRSAARAFAAEDKVEPAASETPAPVAEAAGSWQAALGTVVGQQFAQDATVVRVRAAADAAEVVALTKGQQVQVTQVTTGDFRQVVVDGKVGHVLAAALGDKAPVEPKAADAAPAAGSDAPVAAGGGSGRLFWPTAGSISSPWGMRMHPILKYKRMHGGVDIGGATGAPIYAAADGVVTKAATGYNSGSGNNVRIDHGKGLETAYLHMSKFSVKVGQKVKRGQVIGTVGSTGLSTAPHLHFSVYVNGVNSNPAAYIKN